MKYTILYIEANGTPDGYVYSLSALQSAIKSISFRSAFDMDHIDLDSALNSHLPEAATPLFLMGDGEVHKLGIKTITTKTYSIEPY